MGRCAVGVRNGTPVEFKVKFEPEPKPSPSVPVGTGTFNLERSTLVSRTRPRRRQRSDLPYNPSSQVTLRRVALLVSGTSRGPPGRAARLQGCKAMLCGLHGRL